MKLSQDSTLLMSSLVDTALACGVNTVIVDCSGEEKQVRGIDDKHSVVIISKECVPDLNGKQVAIARLPLLASRMALIKSQGELEIDAVDGKNSGISHFELSSGKSKAQFRCNAIEQVKVPKSLNDISVMKLSLESKVIGLLSQASSAMQSEKITFSSKDLEKVFIECIDSNNDVFSTEVESTIVLADNESSIKSFAHSYPTKSLLAIFKEAIKYNDKTVTNFEFEIGEKGILTIIVNGLNVFILPAV